MRKIIFPLLLLFFFNSDLLCQESDTVFLKQNEIWLRDAFEKIYNNPYYLPMDSLNNEIISRFEKALSTRESFSYPWNELKAIGKIRSEDNKLNIFTWHIEKNINEYEYYGFIQTIDYKNDSIVRLYFLNDKSGSLKNPETLALNDKKWFGALYYGIHTFVYNRNTYYALFGYDFNNYASRKKLIEILTFTHDNEPEFEGDFHTEFDRLKRIIFEYSSQVVMTVRYDDKMKMIIMDHLAPFEPIFTNNYRFYSPDGTYDGITFQKGEFFLEHDIDARNY